MMMMQCLLFLLFFSSFSQIPIVQSRCNHPAELSALLQFKDTFQINCSNHYDYPNTFSWDNTMRLLNGTAEWDGVQCDPVSGHVIGLDLSSSCLQGSINSNNSNIFNRLTHLEHLNLANNNFQESSIPSELGNLSRLTYLCIFSSSFSGTIPDSIGNLVFLRELHLSYCNFSGSLPVSLGKLTNLRVLYLNGDNLIGEIPSSLANLTNLSSLDLSRNRLTGQIPSSLANLTNLSSLDLSRNRLTGQIPSVLANLAQLSIMRLANNQLTGEIPPGFVNPKLIEVDLSNNTLHGSLPIWGLTNLEGLDVGENNLSDTLELDMFLEFRNLSSLVLSFNNLTLLQKGNASITSRLPRLVILGLSSCRLSKFPELLLHQLSYLDLSHNSIEGSIPKWGESMKLFYMDLSHNLITGLDDPQLFLRLLQLDYLDISYNKLRGSVLFPSPSVKTYRVSNNELNGEMPHSFCNLSSLVLLDLSSNRLTGELDPHCFIKSSLMALNLRNNSFHGKIPEFCTSETISEIKMINLNTNQFQGKIPGSLANCLMLEFFDAGNNFINDTFPFWLGSLPHLKVFILKDNALYGSIGNMSSGHWFPELIIIDLSRNRLSGNLTSWHFEKWMAMKNTNFRNPSYMGHDMFGFGEIMAGIVYPDALYDYSLRMYNKGSEIEYTKILDALVGIDLSSNHFEGEIPTTIGDLRGLRLLNLFNNHLSGCIPSSLGDLTQMESLDLSVNWLSGQIPQQLTQLNFLEVFNVSHNNLIGLIPQGRQFNTFANTSYLDNPGLCGEPLSRKCETSGQQDAETHDEITKKGDNWILWMVVSIGFGGGLFIGVAIEIMVDWRMLILSWWRNRNWRN